MTGALGRPGIAKVIISDRIDATPTLDVKLLSLAVLSPGMITTAILASKGQDTCKIESLNLLSALDHVMVAAASLL